MEQALYPERSGNRFPVWGDARYICGMNDNVINDNGAWCWFQDERAVVDADTQTLLVGSIAVKDGPGGENRHGNLELTVVDLQTGAAQIVVLHENFEADDHDVPAFWKRSDGRWLAMYARHKTDDFMFWRISEPNDPTIWGEERFFDWSEWTEGRGVTYANIHELDGKLYCFARAVNDDQCVMVSEDEGTTWQYAGKLFTRPKVGYVNGYTRYDSVSDRVDLITTDHHPRDYNNSIYHGYLAGGALRDSDGTIVDAEIFDAAHEAPSQEKLTTVLPAGTVMAGATLTHAWTSDIRRFDDGTIIATMTARADDNPASEEERWERMRPIVDLRFIYGRYTPENGWQIHHLAVCRQALHPPQGGIRQRVHPLRLRERPCRPDHDRPPPARLQLLDLPRLPRRGSAPR